MNLKLQLKILSFLQFCLWGSWLTTLGSYMFVTLKFDGASIGAVYSSLGIAAVFMPALLGIVADKWLSAKWVYAICHTIGAITLFMAAQVTTPEAMFLVILINSFAYMPTLGLINTISYYRLQNAGMDIVTDFPPIRIWGTIGFIMAMWVVSLSGFELSHMQLYIGAALSAILVLFTLTLPHIPVAKQQANQSWTTLLGLDAFALFKNNVWQSSLSSQCCWARNCRLPTCSVIPSCTASTKIRCLPAASSCSMRQSSCRFRRSLKPCSF